MVTLNFLALTHESESDFLTNKNRKNPKKFKNLSCKQWCSSKQRNSSHPLLHCFPSKTMKQTSKYTKDYHTQLRIFQPLTCIQPYMALYHVHSNITHKEKLIENE